MGLWPALHATAEPITDIHVSDQGRFGSVRLRAAEEGVEVLGHVLENASLGRALNAALLGRNGLQLRAPATVSDLQPRPGGWRVQLQQANGSTLVDCALVVLAEGGRSGLCERLGIAQREQRYGQSAVIATLACEQPHAQVAYERFTPKGPLALLPLPSHEGKPRVALVWTHPEEQAAAVLALEDEAFLQRLQQDSGRWLGAFTRVGKRALYPLALREAEEQIRPGLVLLGNVAHSLHPVAGQGFNLALRDAMALAANVRESLRTGRNPGVWQRLQDYQRQVQGDQTRTIVFSDYMTRLFSSNSPTLALLRKCGMASVDLLPPLRHALSQQAMGFATPRARL